MGVARGARLLDVPCGHGRHARLLAAHGYAVTGVDLSEEFLEAARGEDPEGKVDWVLSDMREVSGECDGAYCLGSSFGYLGHAGDREFVAAVSRRLAVGGRFVLDGGAAAETLLPELKETMQEQVGDITFEVKNHYQAGPSRLDTDYNFVRGGVTETRTSRHHVYTAAEIGRMLEEAGLAVRKCYGGVDGEPFEVGSPQLLMVAQKV